MQNILLNGINDFTAGFFQAIEEKTSRYKSFEWSLLLVIKTVVLAKLSG